MRSGARVVVWLMGRRLEGMLEACGRLAWHWVAALVAEVEAERAADVLAGGGEVRMRSEVVFALAGRRVPEAPAGGAGAGAARWAEWFA